MPIRAILFDKDGTLVDFQRTWGPATYEVLSRLCDGEAVFARLPQLSLFDAGRAAAAAGLPVIIETTDVYGKLVGGGARARHTPTSSRARSTGCILQTTLEHLHPDRRRKALSCPGLAERGLPARPHDQ